MKEERNSDQKSKAYLVVSAGSILFREQKESIGLGIEGKMWGMCRHVFFCGCVPSDYVLGL